MLSSANKIHTANSNEAHIPTITGKLSCSTVVMWPEYGENTNYLKQQISLF
jgi:hypothetical protein